MSCKGILGDGSSCTAAAVRGTEYCIGHSPGLDEERRAWGALGGRNQALGQGKIEDVRSAEAAWGLLARAAAQAIALRAGEGRAKALIAAARAIMVALEVTDTQQRLKALEAQLAALAAKRDG